MKILVTGSHFTPAQAVIEELIKDPKIKVVYFGRKHTQEGDSTLSMESQVLPKLGVKFINITTGRFYRSISPYLITSLLKIPVGFIQSFYHIIKERPDLTLSFGGYVAVPVVINSWLLSIPIIIHEQTLVTGLANKLTSYFADKIAVSFDQTYEFNMDKVIVTGNPIRKGLVEIKNSEIGENIIKIIAQKKSSKLPLILITGGNQGSHAINLAVIESIERLSQLGIIVHQTGDSKYQDFESLSKIKSSLTHPQRYLACKFLNVSEMGYILQNANLVISRAGINTLLEITYFSIPALVIPIPDHNEQSVNAKFFEQKGLARVFDQKHLTGDSLLTEIKQMIRDLPKITKQADEAKSLVIEDAAQRVALETILLAQRN